MTETNPHQPRKLPFELMLSISAVLGVHLLAVVALALSANSGPWPTPYGSDMSPGPKFATVINNFTTQYYLRYLGMSHNYHFLSNRSGGPEFRFEVRLKDENGIIFKTLEFPNPDTNFWVYHRQKLLAKGLGDDQQVQPQPTEGVAEKDLKVGRSYFWLLGREIKALEKKDRETGIRVLPEKYYLNSYSKDLAKGLFDPLAKNEEKKREDNKFYLVSIAEDKEGNLVGKQFRFQMDRPGEWPQLLAKSYLRYLCREHDAFSAELIRKSRLPVYPTEMYGPNPFVNSFDTRECNFGDLIVHLEENDR